MVQWAISSLDTSVPLPCVCAHLCTLHKRVGNDDLIKVHAPFIADKPMENKTSNRNDGFEWLIIEPPFIAAAERMARYNRTRPMSILAR